MLFLYFSRKDGKIGLWVSFLKHGLRKSLCRVQKENLMKNIKEEGYIVSSGRGNRKYAWKF
jgi:hypothetical protein